MEDKGFRVAFVEGQVLACRKGSGVNSAEVIRIRGGLYRLIGRPTQALVHDNISLCEMCHRRLAHLHYNALPALRNMVTGILECQIGHDCVCKGCALGKIPKPFWLYAPVFILRPITSPKVASKANLMKLVIIP